MIGEYKIKYGRPWVFTLCCGKKGGGYTMHTLWLPDLER